MSGDTSELDPNDELELSAASIRQGVPTRVSSWFRVERPARSKAPGSEEAIAVVDGKNGRLRTTVPAQMGEAVSDGSRPVLLEPRSDAVRATLRPYRALIESRIFGATVAPPDPAPRWLDEFRGAPLPEPTPPFRVQLDLLRRRLGAVHRSSSVDWAIERIAAELYELRLSQLVALQDRYGEG